MVDYGPRGTIPAGLRRPVVYAGFAEPMVPLAVLGEAMRESDLMTISPPVRGDFRWYGSRVLAFVPHEPLEGQRTYTVRVASDPPLEFTFEDEPLQVISLSPVIPPGEYTYIDPQELPPERARTLDARFNYTVTPRELEDRLIVLVGGREVRRTILPAEELQGGDHGVRIVLDAVPPVNTPVQVVVDGTSRRGVHTITPFSFERHSASVMTPRRSRRDDSLYVTLQFTHPVDQETVEAALQVRSPRGDVTPGTSLEVWDRVVILQGVPLDPREHLTITFSREHLRDQYGRSLSEDVSVSFPMPDAGSYALFPDHGVRFLEAAYPPQIAWEYQNIREARWAAGATGDPYNTGGLALRNYDLSHMKRHQTTYRILDLEPWLPPSGFGAVALEWNFTGYRNQFGNEPRWTNATQVQVTDLAVTVRHGFNRMAVLVTSLATGDPVAGAAVSVRGTSLAGETDRNGFFSRELPHPWSAEDIELIIRHGDDRIHFVPNRSHDPYRFGFWTRGTPEQAREPRMETMIITDRDVYRPGEEVVFRGLDRTWDPRVGDYRVFSGGHEIRIEEDRWDGAVVHRWTDTTTASGGFAGSAPLPEDLPPGGYRLVYRRLPESSAPREAAQYFRVAWLQRQDLAVEITGGAVVTRGDTHEMEVRASYLGGGYVTHREVRYQWERQPYFFRPPQERWNEWTFGVYRDDVPALAARGTAVLDAQGRATLSLPRDPRGHEKLAHRYVLRGETSDAAGQTAASTAVVVDHPAEFYLAARVAGNSRYTVRSGAPLTVEFTAVTPDGEPFAGPAVSATAVLVFHEWRREVRTGATGGALERWELHEEEVARTTGTHRLTVTPDRPGSWMVRLESRDSQGRAAVTEVPVFATGPGGVLWGERDPGEIRLLPDRDQYAAGDVARLLVQSPRDGGTYLLTVERDGLLEERVVTLEGATSVVEIPIREEHLPVVYVTLSGGRGRTGDPQSYFSRDMHRPQGLFGMTRLLVDPEPRTLSLEMGTSSADWRPGDRGEITVTVTHRGVPVEGAEVTLVAVDRGITDITGYQVDDPVSFFYNPERFPPGTFGADSRSLLLDPVIWEALDLAGGDGDKGGAREEFDPLALFEPMVVTDRNGMVRVAVQWPDTLTTYQITALAAHGNFFGRTTGEAQVTAPLTMRMVIPREIRQRDTLHATVLVTNRTDRLQAPVIVVEAPHLVIPGDATHQPRIPPGATVGIEVPMAALEPREGTVTVRLASGVLDDTLRVPLPVRQPEIRERVAIAGAVHHDSTAREQVILPGGTGVHNGVVHLEISPTVAVHMELLARRMADLPDTFLDIVAMQALAASLVGDDPQGLEGALRRLHRGQQRDGGIAMRETGTVSTWRPSVWTAMLMTLLPPEMVRSGPDVAAVRRYLERQLREGRLSAEGAALVRYTTALMDAAAGGSGGTGDGVVPGDGASTEVLGLAALTAAASRRWDQFDALRERMRSRLSPGMASAALAGREDITGVALLLVVEMVDEREDDGAMVRRLAHSLGRARRPADLMWSLIALAARADQEQPDLEVHALLGGADLATRHFAGRTATVEKQQFSLDGDTLQGLPRGIPLDLELRGRGTGTAWYTVGLDYALPGETITPRDEGLGVTRRIIHRDGGVVAPGDLAHGEVYRMEVAVAAARRWEQVVVDVPVPSGARIVDDPAAGRQDYPGFVRFTFDTLPAGVSVLPFHFRTVNRGIYPLPPVTALVLHEPEVFGRSAGGLAVIGR